jgi:hypothetical protein
MHSDPSSPINESDYPFLILSSSRLQLPLPQYHLVVMVPSFLIRL